MSVGETEKPLRSGISGGKTRMGSVYMFFEMYKAMTPQEKKHVLAWVKEDEDLCEFLGIENEPEAK